MKGRIQVTSLLNIGFQNELRIKTLAERSPQICKSYELWMLPDDDGAPVSLALLPARGSVVVAFDARQQSILATTLTFAVSLESVDGAPTGPVVYTAPLVRS